MEADEKDAKSASPIEWPPVTSYSYKLGIKVD